MALVTAQWRFSTRPTASITLTSLGRGTSPSSPASAIVTAEQEWCSEGIGKKSEAITSPSVCASIALTTSGIVVLSVVF